MKVGILRRVLQEAENSEHHIYRLGAVIFKGSRILGSGHNSFRSSNIPEKYKKYPHTLHAEQSAICSVNDWNTLKGASIVVIRLNKSGNLSKGYPCKYCMESIRHVGIRTLYYSNRMGEIVKEKIWS